MLLFKNKKRAAIAHTQLNIISKHSAFLTNFLLIGIVKVQMSLIRFMGLARKVLKTPLNFMDSFSQF